MALPRNQSTIAALLSFNGGFVDTVGFLGLAGLFTSHVTGNFVTLGAALVMGHHGIINKVLALPEFVAVIALARLAGGLMRRRNWPVLRVFLVVEVALLFAFFALAVWLGPFADTDSPAGLLTGGVGVAAMALQNAFQRVHFADLPPTTIMTGNTTQATLDAVDLVSGVPDSERARITARFRRLTVSITYFAAGCIVAAGLYWVVGFWALGVAVVVGATAAVLRRDEGKAA
ncbi:MAG: YoaK family protein [Pseudolabrys sp.]